MKGPRPKHRAKPPIHPQSLEPPPERWQHGQQPEVQTARRRPTSVQRGVDALLDAGLIGEAEERAATRFAEDYLVGVEGVRLAHIVHRSGRADAHDVAIARASAAGRHHEVAARLGAVMTAWLVGFLVEDLTFVAMAARFWPTEQGRREVKGAVVVLLVMLSRLYAALDRRKATPRRGSWRGSGGGARK
jgi:hypothetical protein